MKVETKIERMETNIPSGDYSAGPDECSLRLVCKAPRKNQIKSGSCRFT